MDKSCVGLGAASEVGSSGVRCWWKCEVEVEGMTELNGCEPRKVTVKSPYTFTIGSTKGLGKYLKGGWANQVVPRTP